MYNIPEEFYFRLHQVRPRFKNDVENVLLYIATEITKLPSLSLEDFNQSLFNSIRLFPGNATLTEKTINNWRTEISALFGFVEEDNINNTARPADLAKKLATEQDLIQFFKYFLYYFQYPGGHIKPDKVKEIINEKIHFKPAQYFLKVLEAGEKKINPRFSINKAEATHFIYNDLRVTRDQCEPIDVVNRIIKNKEVEKDSAGDVIRYAGDILDYMIIADLLVRHGNNYYINWDNRETVTAFLESDEWFSDYDSFYDKNFKVSELKPIEDNWFRFVNSNLDNDLFKTDVLQYLGIEENAYSELVNRAITDLDNGFDPGNVQNTKEIGDLGEGLVLGHECMRMKNEGREDLIHLIKKIPTHLAVGYDIQSVEIDEKKRYIEAKTTLSRERINFYNFHLTRNEWNVAGTLTDKYFVYRLMINKKGKKVEKKLFIINDPVTKFKKDQLKMTIRDGADIIFNDETGEREELLIWDQ